MSRELLINASTLIDQFVNQAILPELIQNSGLALLTTIIAVAVFLVERGSEFDFDRKIILNEVIDAKLFLISVAYIFLPLFLWNLSVVWRPPLFFISFIGICLLIRTLYHAYKWMNVFESADYRNMESYRMNLRLQYLGGIADSEEKVGVWSYILKLDHRSVVEEREFIRAFLKSVKILAANNDENSWELVARYLKELQAAIDHVSLYDWAIFEAVIKNVLQIRFDVRGNKQGKLKTFLHLRGTLDSFLGLLIKKGLQVGGAYVLFEELTEHFKSLDNEEKYVRKMVKVVSGPFFENVADSPESNEIWDAYFPSDWKITKETMVAKNNIMAKYWMDDFSSWALRRIQEYKDDWDKKLDEVSRELFSTADPITWSIILTFILRPWAGDKRMKALIEKPRKFGSASLVIEETEEEVSRQIEAQRRNAIELALMLFPRTFTREKLETYISELKAMIYQGDSREADAKAEVEQIFNEMLGILGTS